MTLSKMFTFSQLKKDQKTWDWVPSTKIGKLRCQSLHQIRSKQVLLLEILLFFETLLRTHQYSQRQDASIDAPSHISVPPWSPRRYLPLEPLMAMRPCSGNSRKKSSDFSPSEFARPLLETYQNFPFTPVGKDQLIMIQQCVEIKSAV